MPNKFFPLLFCLCALLFATTTRYVNVNSAGGDGTTTGLTGANAAFASMAAAEAARYAAAPVTDPWVIVCHASVGDTDRTYMKVRTVTGGSYTNNVTFQSDNDSLKYMQFISAGVADTIEANWCIFKGIKIMDMATNEKVVYVAAPSTSTNLIKFDKCIFIGKYNDGFKYCFYSFGNEDTIKIFNSIFVNSYVGASYGQAIYTYAVAGTKTYVKNCTFSHFANVIHKEVGKLSCYNIGVYKLGLAFGITGKLPDTLVNIDTVNVPAFIDSTNFNYRLAAGDAVWGGAGTDQSAHYTTDIDNKTITTWMIGASFPPAIGCTPWIMTNANDGHGTFTPATGLKDSAVSFNIDATSAAGYRFWKWTRSGVQVVITDSAASSTSAYLKAAGTITLNDTIIHYLATNAVTGSGTFTPATDLQDSGSVFAIVATPAAHYAFTSWSVSGGAHVTSTTTASTTAWMTGAGTITANFHSIQYTLTIAVSGPGTTTPPPGDVLLDTAIRQTIHGTPTSAWDTLAHWTGTTGVHFNPDSSACSLSASGTATALFGMRVATVPTQTSPAQGDTVKNKTVNFQWSAQATTDSAFILALSTDSTTFLYDTTITNSKSKTLSDNTKYFWKVKGGNPGGWSAYSTVLRFRTLAAASSAGGWWYRFTHWW